MPSEPGEREAVADLFGRALELPEGERGDFVASSGAPDWILREVLQLLDALPAEGRGRGQIDPQLAAALLGQESLTEDPAIGRTIGPYRLLSLLGRGGMGVVYLAERSDGAYEQQVAFKLLPLSIQSDSARRRFTQERQILARLEHPGIARILDGGVGDDGEPYFVMEFVDGAPLTRWCDDRRRGIRRRLDLFLQVCEAVQSAHAQLIVHRDLKPSNILVTESGEIKLLDFGIARMLAEEGEDGTVLTVGDLHPYTPGYAAPEQLDGGVVSVATDVYTLGVILYELLCGHRPAGDGPTRPSSASNRTAPDANGPAPDPATIAANRSSSPQRLARRLQGDLDTIALKALRADPEERYASVQELAADLRRHLAGEPITARPPSAPYRAAKFVRRHWIGVGAMALVLIAVLVGLAATARQAGIARRQRDVARLEAEKLAATQEYLVGLFKAADPAQARGETVTATQLVERGIERVSEDLADQPEVQTDIYQVLGRVALELGDYEQAEKLLEEALPRARRLYGDEHLETADLLSLRGELSNLRSDWAGAEPDLRDALAIYRQQGVEGDTAGLSALAQLGSALRNQGKLDEAGELYRHGIDLVRAAGQGGSAQAATLLNNLVGVLVRTGDLDGASTSMREVLAIYGEQLGADHPRVAMATNNLAGLLAMKGDLRGAEQYSSRAIELEGKLRGQDHPRYASKLDNHANLLHATGRYSEALAMRRQALQVLEKTMPDEELHLAVLDRLAGDLAALGEADAAAAQFDDAGARIARHLGADSLRYGIHRWRLAGALLEQGDVVGALEVASTAVSALEGIPGRGEPWLAVALQVRGTAHLEQGQLELAEADLTRALEIHRRTLPPEHYEAVPTLVSLARVFVAQGRSQNALPLAREASRVAATALPPGQRDRLAAEDVLRAAQQ